MYLDHIFEVMIYIDNSADYDQPWKCIDNIKVIQEIVKKSGMRCMITGAPTHENLNKEIKYAVRRWKWKYFVYVCLLNVSFYQATS